MKVTGFAQTAASGGNPGVRRRQAETARQSPWVFGPPKWIKVRDQSEPRRGALRAGSVEPSGRGRRRSRGALLSQAVYNHIRLLDAPRPRGHPVAAPIELPIQIGR